MIHPYEISKTLERMTADYQRHTKLKEELKSKIAQLADEGRSKKWEEDQTKKLRDEYVPK